MEKRIIVNLKRKGLISLHDVTQGVLDKLKTAHYLGTKEINGEEHLIFRCGKSIFQETEISRSRKYVSVYLTEVKEQVA